MLLPKGHPLAAKDKITPKDPAQDQMFLLDAPPSADYFPVILRDVGTEPVIALRSSSFETVCGLAARGLGYALRATQRAALTAVRLSSARLMPLHAFPTWRLPAEWALAPARQPSGCDGSAVLMPQLRTDGYNRAVRPLTSARSPPAQPIPNNPSTTNGHGRWARGKVIFLRRKSPQDLDTRKTPSAMIQSGRSIRSCRMSSSSSRMDWRADAASVQAGNLSQRSAPVRGDLSLYREFIKRANSMSTGVQVIPLALTEWQVEIGPTAVIAD